MHLSPEQRVVAGLCDPACLDRVPSVVSSGGSSWTIGPTCTGVDVLGTGRLFDRAKSTGGPAL